MARMVQCVYLKKESEGMSYAPYPGELGKRIYDNVSKEAFEAWKRHQTMLVNENRLNLADARARQYLARQMEQFFFGAGADAPAGFVPSIALRSEAYRGLADAARHARPPWVCPMKLRQWSLLYSRLHIIPGDNRDQTVSE